MPSPERPAVNGRSGGEAPTALRAEDCNRGHSVFRSQTGWRLRLQTCHSRRDARGGDFRPSTMRLQYIICILSLFAAFPAASPLHAQDLQRTLHVGQSEVYGFDRMTTAAVGSPLVADIVPLSSHQLLVNAKSLGVTTLFVCDHAGTHRMRLSVVPTPVDLRPVASVVQAAIGLPGVTASAVQDTLFLEGTVPNALAFQRASAIAGVYAPKIKNLLTLTPDLTPAASLAQTYAALLAPSLAPLGIDVQVVDDRTVALSGQYLSPSNAPGASPDSADWPAPTTRRKAAGKRGAATEAGDDDPDPEVSGKEDVKKEDVKASGRESAGRKSASAILPSDPLDRLISSLPPELKVVNLLNLSPGPTRQILVRAKIIDIDRIASKSLGVDWGSGVAASVRGGNSYSFQSQPILFGQLGSSTSHYTNLLGGGAFGRILPLAAQISALVSENKARILSEPSLMVLDGCEGSILVGGEIPIPVAQASNGSGGATASVAIEYKPYGVRLLVSAALVGENRIQMTVTPEVSELDYGAGLQLSGFSIPALTVRRATSTLQMTDGETLVIGGLYSNTVSRQVNRIPVLSQIPVLGEFFKSTVTRKQESELLILIEPEIVTPDTPGALPPPPGSLENLPVQRPDVGRTDFDKDFPDLQKGGGDTLRPGRPVSLPAPSAAPIQETH